MPFSLGKLVESASKRLSFSSPITFLPDPDQQDDNPKVAITERGRYTKVLKLPPPPSPTPNPNALPVPIVSNLNNNSPSKPAPAIDPNNNGQQQPDPGNLPPPPPPFSPTAPPGFTISDVPEFHPDSLHPQVGSCFVYSEGTKKGERAGLHPASGSKSKPILKPVVHLCCGVPPPCGFGPAFPSAFLKDGTTTCFGLVNRSEARLSKDHDEYLLKSKKNGKLIRIGTHLCEAFPLHIKSIDDMKPKGLSQPCWRTIMKPHPYLRGCIHLKDKSGLNSTGIYVVDGYFMDGPCRILSQSYAGAWAAMADFKYISIKGPKRNGGPTRGEAYVDAQKTLHKLETDYPMPPYDSDLWSSRIAPYMIIDADHLLAGFLNPSTTGSAHLHALRHPILPDDDDVDPDEDGFVSCDDDSVASAPAGNKGGEPQIASSSHNSPSRQAPPSPLRPDPVREILIPVYQAGGGESFVSITPPKGCPFSKPGEYWRLIKTLYGLRRSPRHWYLLFRKVLEDIGLKACPHDPCVFTGTSPTGGTIYFGCYVDDCLYFGTDNETEQWFERELGKKVTIDFMGPVAWYLGVYYSWGRTSTGKLTVQLSQEGYINKMLGQEGLEDCIAVDTPYRSGLTIDRVPHDGVEPAHKQMIVKKYASLVGGLNWLSTSTRPDITTATSLLASHLKNPSEGHIEAGRHVLRYLKGCSEWGIRYTQPDDDEPDTIVRQMRGEVAWPVDGGPSSGVESMDRLVVETDANWGPQDASKPKPGEMRKEEECRSVLGAVVIYLGGPLDWCATREKKTSRSTCDAEIKGMDEGCKMVEGIRHLQEDLQSDSIELPTPLLMSDNQGAICWSKTDAITKKLRYLNLREVAVRDAVRTGAIEIGHIPGKLNLSDIFTKEMRDKPHFLDLRCGLMSPREILE